MSSHVHRYPPGNTVAASDWAVALCHEHVPMDPGCQPAVLDRHVYLDPRDYSTFQHMEYRAACYGCDWIGGVVPTESAATEHAHDHAFPGWRALPVVKPARPDQPQRLRSDLLRAIERLYPPDWLRRHGPILVRRQGRSVPSYSPTGGYEMATGDGPAHASGTPKPPEQADLF